MGRMGRSLETTETKDAAHDITKAHTLSKDIDGGLTKAERAQLGAAVTDLVGMGVSLLGGTVGNVGGAALGFGASTAQIIADKNRQKEGADISNWDIG